jgi:hypothetical protein
MPTGNCRTCALPLDAADAESPCRCNAKHHFVCLKKALIATQDTYACPVCKSETRVPTVYYASKIGPDSAYEDVYISPEELLNHRELRRPFHYRVGHWAMKGKHAGEEDDAPGRSFAQIKDADYVLADVTRDAQGTICEVGLAIGMDKTVFLVDPLGMHEYKYRSLSGQRTYIEVASGAEPAPPLTGVNGVVTRHADIWFVQDLAYRSQRRLHMHGRVYFRWKDAKHMLPIAMQQLTVQYDGNGGTADGHFMEFGQVSQILVPHFALKISKLSLIDAFPSGVQVKALLLPYKYISLNFDIQYDGLDQTRAAGRLSPCHFPQRRAAGIV